MQSTSRQLSRIHRLALEPLENRLLLTVFDPAVTYGVVDGAHGTEASDLDADGDLDLVVSNFGDDTISVLFNNGDATFVLDANYTVGNRPQDIEPIDLDGDGDTDLAVGNFFSNDVSVLLNNGDGTFVLNANFAVASAANFLAAADLDGDGDHDLAVSNHFSQNISVLLNDGNAFFVLDANYFVGTFPGDVVATDLDGDSDADLAVTNNFGFVNVLFNNGDGTFVFDADYGVANTTGFMAGEDLDGDGDTDLAVASHGQNEFFILLNNGDGTLVLGASYPASQPADIEPFDVDGDGDLDLAVTLPTGDGVDVFLNNGNATFMFDANYAVGDHPIYAAAGDFDGDGDPDLAVGNFNGQSVSMLLNTFACVAPPSEMVSWWDADSVLGTKANDIQNGNDGTLTNGATTAPGKVGQAFSFDGIDDYVSVPDNASLDVGTGDFSLDAWMKSDATGVEGFYGSIIDKRDDSRPTSIRGYVLNMNDLDGRLAFQMADGVGAGSFGGFTNFQSNVFVADGVWHHVAVTVDRDSPTGGKLYVDGDVVLTFDPTVRPGSLDNDKELRMGRITTPNASTDPNTGGPLDIHYKGQIDEVEIFKRALFESEIQSIFNAGSAGKCKLPANQAPVADPEGPYVINEGDSLQFDGSGSSDPDDDSMSFAWELNGDNTFDDATGAQPTLTYTQLQALGLGIGVHNIALRVDDGNGETDEAATTLTINNLVDLSGRVFDDRDNDGAFEPADGDHGLENVTMKLVNEVGGAVVDTTATAADGTYAFRMDVEGTYSVRQQSQPSGYLDGNESTGSLGGTADNITDSNAVMGVVIGPPGSQPDTTGYDFAELLPASVQGLVWEDFDADGEVDLGELAVDNVLVTLNGTDDRGNPVNLVQATDAEGIYEFVDLRPGLYMLKETQPTELGGQATTFIDGEEVPGELLVAAPGVVLGNDGVVDPGENDKFSQIQLVGGAAGVNYNFGERVDDGPMPNGGVTATIGFWQNKNGQNLIKSLNGSEASTLLADWLSSTFPNMYGTLVGMENAGVADTFKQLFKRNGSNSPAGSPKLDAQVMATALATYVTKESFVSIDHSTLTVDVSLVTGVESFGFDVTVGGLGSTSFNVGDAGAAFGVADNSNVLIIDLLLAVDGMAHNGILYDIDDDGQIDSLEESLRVLANDVFSAINEFGDI